MTETKSMVPVERIEQKILRIREHNVMLDADLATLYEVGVKVLNQAVKRNIERFPEDFMFQLTAEEDARLRSQSVTLKTGRGQHRKYPPYAFTEQGVAMLSSVLRSERAVQSTSKSCAPLSGSGGCSRPTKSSPASSPCSKRNTMRSSRWSSTPSDNSWPPNDRTNAR